MVLAILGAGMLLVPNSYAQDRGQGRMLGKTTQVQSQQSGEKTCPYGLGECNGQGKGQCNGQGNGLCQRNGECDGTGPGYGMGMGRGRGMGQGRGMGCGMGMGRGMGRCMNF